MWNRDLESCLMRGIEVLQFVLCIRILSLVSPGLLLDLGEVTDGFLVHEVLVGKLAEKVGFTHISISSSLMPMVTPLLLPPCPRSSHLSHGIESLLIPKVALLS